jgi:nicotinamide riboside transporter PnuC
MKIIFPLFLSMLAIIALGVWMHTTVLANIVGLASITGLLIFYFKQSEPLPEQSETLIDKKINVLTKEQKKQWYSLFIIGLIFSFIFGTFWNDSMGGM